MEDYKIQNVETVSNSVSQRRGGGCCIHQTVMTTHDDDWYWYRLTRLGDLVAAALRQIDDSNYDLVAEQVAAMEAVVAKVNLKQIDYRVEKLEKELAELKRELERCRQDRWPWAKTLGRTTVAVASGVLLSDGLRISKLRGVRNLLNLILDE